MHFGLCIFLSPYYQLDVGLIYCEQPPDKLKQDNL